MSTQKLKQYILSNVLDPTSAISAFSPHRKDETLCEYLTSPLTNIEYFGVHFEQDSRCHDLVWKKPWVNTLSSLQLLGNRDYVAGQIFDLGNKLGQAEGHLTNRPFGGMLSQQKKEVQKPPLCFLARRHFSSKPDPGREPVFVSKTSDAEALYTKGFDRFGPGCSNAFIQREARETRKFSMELNMIQLRAEFESEFRPLIAAHCLLLPNSVDHYTTAYLHGPNHGISKNDTLYLSARDIMVRRKTLKEWQRKLLMSHILDHRVLVCDDWVNTYGNIEMMQYDFGSSGPDFVRGECDSSFQSSLAKLAVIIWKGKKLLWAEVIENVPCNDSHHGEVLAALALLNKCEDMGFLNVDLWTDSRRAWGVISGAEIIYTHDKNYATCCMVRSVQRKFTKVVPILKPRELMFLPDQLLRHHGFSGCIVKRAIKMWSTHLEGCRIFKITHNQKTTSIINSFVQKQRDCKNAGYTYTPKTTYFWRVKKDKKIGELQWLRRFLEPESMHLVIDSFEKVPALIKKQLSDMFPIMSTAGSVTTFRDPVIVNPKQRALVVIWDASISSSHHNGRDCCTIILAEDDEVSTLRGAGIGEISIETYLYFHREEFLYSKSKK